eukprot:2454888-Pleurochrysis_carterae.AAC.2
MTRSSRPRRSAARRIPGQTACTRPCARAAARGAGVGGAARAARPVRCCRCTARGWRRAG